MVKASIFLPFYAAHDTWWAELFFVFLLLTRNVLHVNCFSYAYPNYCTKIPLNPQTRQSPPLSSFDRSRQLTFYQVHLIFRHGARTPSAFQSCWENYNPIWNCPYDEVIQGSFSGATSRKEPFPQTFFFKKMYNADPGDNVFHGTCEKGQLLIEGAEQHTQLGRFAAESYLDSESPHKLPAPGTPPLFDNASPHQRSLYIRTTDMQRTRLSAANLVTSLLKRGFKNSTNHQGAPFIMHTMDIENDYMLQSHQHCSALSLAFSEAIHDARYPALQTHKPQVYQRLENVFSFSLASATWGYQALDCVMPYTCSDRWTELPNLLRPNGTDPAEASGLQNAMLEAINDELSYLMLFNASRYAKLAIAHFTAALRTLLVTPAQSTKHTAELHLWSGHDTTLIPLLGAFIPEVWDKQWPPYASLFIIEVYRLETPDGVVTGSDPLQRLYFRLVYNGKLVTHGIPGCVQNDVCPLDNFLNAISWADAYAKECVTPVDNAVMNQLSSDTSQRSLYSQFHHKILQSPTGALLGFLAGVVTTLVFLRLRNYLAKQLMSTSSLGYTQLV